MKTFGIQSNPLVIFDKRAIFSFYFLRALALVLLLFLIAFFIGSSFFFESTFIKFLLENALWFVLLLVLAIAAQAAAYFYFQHKKKYEKGYSVLKLATQGVIMLLIYIIAVYAIIA